MWCLGAVALAMGAAAPARGQVESTRRPETRRGSVEHVAGRRQAIWLDEGDHLEAGTCGLDGAETEGDTVLRLRDPSGQEVTWNDDGCLGSYGSRVTHDVPRGGAGTYHLVAACYAGGKCGGRIVHRVEHRGLPEPASGVRLSAHARALLGVDRFGAGLVSDLSLEVRTLAPFVFRLDAGPAGLAGGVDGGLFGGAAQLTFLLDWEWMAVGVGVGVGALGRRHPTVSDQQAALLGLRARLGDLTGFRVVGELRGAVVASEIRTHSLRIEARLPLDELDLVLRGAGGDEGIAMGELAAVIWVDRAPNRPRLGVSVSVGAGAVFYEPECRFGNPCGQTHWYGGPTVGAGLEWRP